MPVNAETAEYNRPDEQDCQICDLLAVETGTSGSRKPDMAWLPVVSRRQSGGIRQARMHPPALSGAGSRSRKMA
jgi:hypothetical protein